MMVVDMIAMLPYIYICILYVCVYIYRERERHNFVFYFDGCDRELLQVIQLCSNLTGVCREAACATTSSIALGASILRSQEPSIAQEK